MSNTKHILVRQKESGISKQKVSNRGRTQPAVSALQYQQPKDFKSNPPIQRYIKPIETNEDYRVSDNKNIVTLLPQSVFATKEKISEAAVALHNVNSMVTVTEDTDGRTPWEPFEGGVRSKTVYPVKVAWVPETIPGGSVHEALSGTNAKSILYHSWADCHRTAQSVMGSHSRTSDNKEQPLIKQEDGYNTMTPLSSTAATATGVNLSDAQANRGIYAVFEYAFPKFVDILKSNGFEETQKILIERINAKKSAKTDKSKILYWWVTYKNYILKDPVLEDLFAKSFGINDYAAPEIGDTLSQVGSESERAIELNKAQKLAQKYELSDDAPLEEIREAGATEKELSTIRDLWNFHWAGVIMKDGGDYLTLENLSVENISVINKAWYFKLYGQGKQSFHSFGKKDPHSGDAPVTTGFRHVPGAVSEDKVDIL